MKIGDVIDIPSLDRLLEVWNGKPIYICLNFYRLLYSSTSGKICFVCRSVSEI